MSGRSGIVRAWWSIMSGHLQQGKVCHLLTGTWLQLLSADSHPSRERARGKAGLTDGSREWTRSLASMR